MAIISIRSRTRIGVIGLSIVIVVIAWLMQLTVLSKLSLNDVLCSLPLTVTIIWGSVFGSSLRKPSADELRISPLSQVMLWQALGGSPSGALIGAFFAALYSTLLPVYPVCYPVIGWLAGYFTLRNFNQATLLCIPLVLLATVFAETLLALQLHWQGRPDVLPRLADIAFSEAILNALIAPFVYFPMRGWYEFFKLREVRE